MASINLANENSKLDVTPWFESGYIFKELTMREEIGGNLASGVIKLTSDGTDMSLINTQNTLDITYIQLPWDDKEEQVEYKVKGYIYHKEFKENEIHMSFVAVSDRDFSTLSKMNTYENLSIDKVISDLYPDKDRIKFLDSNDQLLQPDMNEPLTITQNALTNLDFCKRLCRSYRKDSVFAFGLEGLFIKSIYRNPPEPIEIVGESDSIVMGMFNMNDYKEMTMTEDPRELSVNLAPVMYGFDYYITRNDYYAELLKVYLYNTRYYTAMKCSMKLRFITRLPKFKLGDIVTYKDPHKFNQDRKYVVTFISIEIIRNEITMNCELSSWDDVRIPS